MNDPKTVRRTFADAGDKQLETEELEMTKSQPRSTLWITFFAFLLLIGALAPAASALGPLDPRPGPWSLAMEQECAMHSFDHWSCYLWTLDPPPDIAEISFDIKYNPADMLIVDTGFLCDFAAPGTGSCPVTVPGTTDGDASSVVLGDPLAGSTYTLTLTPGEIQVDYVLPPGDVSTGPDENFFGIMFDSPFLASNVQFETTPGDYDFYYVSTSCTTSDPLNPSCGSDSPYYGVDFTPEPSTITLLAPGALAVLGARRWRVVRRRGRRGGRE
jgi:hypothetical protein